MSLAISALCIALFIFVVMYVIYMRADILDMEQKLNLSKERVAQKTLMNDYLSLSLSKSDIMLEHMIRANLDYAKADEKIFVDSSSVLLKN